MCWLITLPECDMYQQRKYSTTIFASWISIETDKTQFKISWLDSVEPFHGFSSLTRTSEGKSVNSARWRTFKLITLPNSKVIRFNGAKILSRNNPAPSTVLPRRSVDRAGSTCKNMKYIFRLETQTFVKIEYKFRLDRKICPCRRRSKPSASRRTIPTVYTSAWAGCNAGYLRKIKTC